MKKLLFATVMAVSCSLNLLAGGLLTNTNQSIHFLRNPARGASTEIDAVYTNPAGLSLLPRDGFHFAINNQSAFQTRTINSTYAPFEGFGGSQTKKFKGEASAPIIPSVQAAYKTGDWVLSGSFAVTGGGGKATFNKGLASFESTVAIVPAVLNSFVPTIGGYSVNSYMEGASFIYGAQLGGTYAINEMFSAFGGFRLNIVNNSYEGYLRNIKYGIGGQMVPATDVIAMNPAFGDFLPLATDKELKCEQSGWGITPILGVNFNWQKLNVGVKYEFNTHLNVENKTSINTTGMAAFDEGVNTPHDIPSLLTIGASYDIIEPVTVSVGYHHFFDANASMGGKEKYINGGVNEFLAGVEYRINKMFLVSCGGQITRTGVEDAYQSDLSFSLNSYSLGFGGAVNVTENVRINVAYFFTNYSDWTKESADYGGINALTNGAIPAMAGKDVFSRTNKVFGIGVDFSF
ncbi:long-chain fatty acid transport protein [Dysgonomonadaceae bacterium PH5-43]|nr:long-chain fatty acid transport protein [Dysgonomonadaceae bacterium PH5-43]